MSENKRQTKMKLKVSRECTRKNGIINSDHKYTMRGFERHLPSAVAVSDTAVFFGAVAALIV